MWLKRDAVKTCGQVHFCFRLSAVAIATLKAKKINHLFPEPDENFIKAVIGDDVGGNEKQGGIPNRFKGLTAQVNADFPANEVANYVQYAWRELAETVWMKTSLALQKNDIDPASIREIWDRQVQYLGNYLGAD